MKLEGKAKMIRIHFGEADKWEGKPLYQAIVEKCREMDIAGATVYRGIEGYGASTRIHRARHLLSFSSDAPIMAMIIDSEENIARLIPAIEPMLREGLIAVSNVEVIKYVHDAVGNLISRTNPRVFTTTYQYDGLNRLVKETRPLGDPLQADTRFFYDGTWPEGAPSYHAQTVGGLEQVLGHEPAELVGRDAHQHASIHSTSHSRRASAAI